MAPCRFSRRAAAAAPALTLLASLAAPGFAVAGPPFPSWIRAVPSEASESALTAAVALDPPAIERLKAVTAAHPGTPASGLAQLEAGLRLIEARRAADAIPFLKHEDVAYTALSDFARAALAEAYEAAGDLPRAAAAWLDTGRIQPAPVDPCTALYRGGDALARSGHADAALVPLQQVVTDCPSLLPAALLRLAQVQEARRDARAAAGLYDRLDREFPASTEARSASPRRVALARHLPPATPAERQERALKRALALCDAERYRDCGTALKALLAGGLAGPGADEARVRLGRALLALNREREAATQLSAVGRGSPAEAEAAFQLARIQARRSRSLAGYERVATSFPKTVWAEDALLNMALHFLRDLRLAEAAPFLRRLLAGFPDGRYVERAEWWLAWNDYQAGRYEDAARRLETAAHERPDSATSAGFLYWAGRARDKLRQDERARELYEETVRRFKHTFHGLRAAEALHLPREAAAAAGASPPSPELDAATLGPSLTRIRQLLLIERLDLALAEAGRQSADPRAQATAAWIHSRQGRLRAAITTMRRAYPEWRTAAGDQIPAAVWEIMYPLQYRDHLVSKAQEEKLDPALVAALIWQESTFDAGAVSSAGARGLMQIVPGTGRRLARSLGLRYRPQALHDPAISLDLGTRYLRQMLDQFGGRVERALAAYNAGPSRVVAWTAGRPDVPAEEFIASIPFTETRNYVMGVLAHREHYRRLYGLPGGAPGSGPSAGGE